MSGFLVEHHAGNFPLWLAPVQVHVITLNDDAAFIESSTQSDCRLRRIYRLVRDGVAIYFTPLYTTIDTRV